MSAPCDKSSRQNFERYAAEQGERDFEQNEFGDYKNPNTNARWNYWRASAMAVPSATHANIIKACRDLHVYGATHEVVGAIIKALSEHDNA